MLEVNTVTIGFGIQFGITICQGIAYPYFGGVGGFLVGGGATLTGGTVVPTLPNATAPDVIGGYSLTAAGSAGFAAAGGSLNNSGYSYGFGLSTPGISAMIGVENANETGFRVFPMILRLLGQ